MYAALLLYFILPARLPFTERLAYYLASIVPVFGWPVTVLPLWFGLAVVEALLAVPFVLLVLTGIQPVLRFHERRHRNEEIA